VSTKSIPSFQTGIQIRHFAWKNKRVDSAYQDNFFCSSSSHAQKSSSFFYSHFWQNNLDTNADHKNHKNSREKSIIHNCDLNSGVCYILIFTSEDYHEPTHSPTFQWLSGGRGGEIPSKSHPRDESERHNTHKTHTHTQFWVSEIQGSSKTVPLPRSLKLCFHLFRMVGR
jgi:hypothetical protein